MPQDPDIKPSSNHRNPDAVREKRQRVLYLRQMDGLTPRQLVIDHAAREGISISTAWRDWTAVQTWNEEDFASQREQMHSRLTSARWRLFNKSFQKGHYQTASAVLDGLSRSCGDGTDPMGQAAASAPNLSISIEAPGASFTTGENK